MNTGICFPEIIISNLIGVILDTLILIDMRWKISGTSLEKRCLRIMLYCSIISCIIEPLTFFADGRSGFLNFLFLYYSNLWLFASNLIIGSTWFVLICTHILGRIDRMHRIFLTVLCTTGTFFLILNSFLPIVFRINEENVYSRGSLYWFYFALDFLILTDGSILYLKAKKNRHTLRFFPLFQFVVPLFTGSLIQSLFYGISTMWAFIAISISSMVFSLQREYVYCDNLTGLYNRYYLNVLAENFQRDADAKITAFMLDLNGFKFINDQYGHAEGDAALQAAAALLKQLAEPSGIAIRYAGDEFLILLSTSDLKTAETFRLSIDKAFRNYNALSDKPYLLSAAVGYSIISFSGHSKAEVIRNLIKEIDFRMYQDKDFFYEKHPENARRKPQAQEPARVQKEQ